MKKRILGNCTLEVPVIASGCMRIDALEEKQLQEYISTCLELGIDFFDHADIYAAGLCEEKFGCAFEKMNVQREDIILQSKCGIVPGVMYDFSKEHILRSVEDSLRRLRTEYLDLLVLHRPDALVEPEEVAEVFDYLQESGKVRHFGVSNHTPMQIELLKKYIKQELLVNQLQFSAPFSNMVASGLEVNMLSDGSVNRDGYLLDYCRLHNIAIQAWSPFQYGFFEGVYIGSEKYPELNQVLESLADKYEVSPTTIATAWILRHPAKMQVIAGTTKVGRLREIAQATEIELTREEWYRIYLAAGHILP
ncbi:MAG: aldo/keto reductase [Candidatus Ruminococcus intestinipullorum]|nr:aldo/keto reductase [Candidatus Ruminococcus intestinipullorum]